MFKNFSHFVSIFTGPRAFELTEP